MYISLVDLHDHARIILFVFADSLFWRILRRLLLGHGLGLLREVVILNLGGLFCRISGLAGRRLCPIFIPVFLLLRLKVLLEALAHAEALEVCTALESTLLYESL
jgi:hypothetical protein